MEEKINDPEYRKKYYDKPNADGVVSRKDTDVRDHNPETGRSDDGEPVPQIRKEGDRYVLASEQTPEPPNWQGRRETLRGDDVDPRVRRDNQDLIDERRAENRAVSEAEARSPEEKAAQAKLTKLGEDLGDRAGSHSVPEIYPGPPPPARLDDNLGGQNRFDQVWETGDGRLIVVEAKGPSARLGEALTPEGKLVKQGHDEYFDKMIGEMKNNELTDRQRARMERNLAAEGKSPGEVDRIIADHEAALAKERQIAERLDAARNDPAHPGVEYVVTHAKVKEMDVDDYLRQYHAEAVDGLSPDELARWKTGNDYGDKYPDGKIDVYDGYVTEYFRMKWQSEG